MPPEPSHADSPAAAGTAAGASVPAGYLAIPISPDFRASPLKICALVRQAADPVSGRLVLLRDTADARASLGVIVDAGGQVVEWVEIWAQRLDGIANTLSAWREALSNAALDERWRQWARFLSSSGDRSGDRSLIVQTGWESEHPPPVWLNPDRREPVALTDPASGEVWRLCRDDAVLAAAQLPAYTTSLHRYLYLPNRAAQGAEGRFIPATAGAPEGPRTVPLESVLGPAAGEQANPADLVPFNPGGGLLLVRPHGGLALEAFVDLLGGGPADATALAGAGLAGAGPAGAGPAGAGPATGTSPARDAWLFAGESGRGARLLETLHLKLRVLADAVRAVRSLVEQTRRPMLNIGPECFRVRLGQPGAGLPVLWTAVTHLVEPGDAAEFQAGDAPTGGAKYFLPARPPAASAYWPAAARLPAQGTCILRLDAFQSGADGSTLVEGSLQTQERFQASAGDLVRLRANVGDSRVDFYARFDAFRPQPGGEGASPPQWQFRATGPKLGPDAEARLRAGTGAESAKDGAAAGAMLPAASFEVVPLWNTPSDLYALGVLAVRVLLVNNGTALPPAVDELTGLARHVADEYDDSAPLRVRVRFALESDPGWLKSLGPHRLSWEGLTPEQAFDLLPAELWSDVLAMVVRTFPGVGPDSACKSFADVPPDAPHRVFDALAADLDRLLVRTRSMIVVDWRSNREVNAILRSYLPAAGAVGAPAGAQGPPPAPPPLPAGSTGAAPARGRPTRAGDAKAR